MAGYTKGDYYAQYGKFLRYPADHPAVQAGLIEANARMAGYKGPYFPGTLEGTEPPVRVKHYWPVELRRKANWVADKVLEQYTITSADKVMVFGGAFGWLCEALEAKTGCHATCVDASDWVQQVKDRSPDTELEEAIIGSGLDPTVGHGKKVFDDFKTTEPYTTAVVDNRDLREMRERKDFEKDRGEYNIVITEDVWQTLTAQEQQDYTTAFEDIGVTTIIHYMDGRVF